MRTAGALVLSVSPFLQDQALLRAICELAGWKMCTVSTCREAVVCSEAHHPWVVVCESELPDGTWKDLLRVLDRLADAPTLVVTSPRTGDDLWSEVRKMGGCDVLTKPLHREEALPVLGLALLAHQWRCKRADHSPRESRRLAS